MDAPTNVNPTMRLNPVALALAATLLAGCGESDLPEHHRELLAEAAAEQGATALVEPQVGAANGQEGTDAVPAPALVEPGGGSDTGEGADTSGTDAPGADTSGTDTSGTDTSDTDTSTTVPIGSGDTTGGGGADAGVPSTDGGSQNGGGMDTDGNSDAGTPPDPDAGPDAGAGTGTDTGAGTDSGTDGGAGAETATGGPATGGGAEPAAPGSASGGPPTTAGGPVEAIDLDDYEIAFNDEFDGTALDPAKWKTAFEYGNAAVEQERQYYVDSLDSDAGLGYDPFTVAGGTLTIQAIETPDEMRADVSGRDWLSGVISTAGGRFEFDSGYAEIRVDLPEGAGLGSMFTLIASDYSAPPRPMVIAMRHDGDDADELMHDYQFTDDGGTRRTPGVWTVSDESPSDGFHTVGVSWDAEGLVYFVDGKATYRVIGDDLPAQSLYLVANLAIGGASRSEPDDATPSPSALVIDHVRVWRKRP